MTITLTHEELKNAVATHLKGWVSVTVADFEVSSLDSVLKPDQLPFLAIVHYAVPSLIGSMEIRAQVSSTICLSAETVAQACVAYLSDNVRGKISSNGIGLVLGAGQKVIATVKCGV